MDELEMPPSDENFIKTYGPAIGTILLIIMMIYYCVSKSNNIEKNGVVTVAKVMEYEAAEQGSSLRIHVYLEHKVITAHVSNDCYFCIGGYYFVKVLKDDPDSYLILYMDKPVPDCIIRRVGFDYFKGWKDFPDCSNF